MKKKIQRHRRFWAGQGPSLLLISPQDGPLYDTADYRRRFLSPALMWEAEMRRVEASLGAGGGPFWPYLASRWYGRERPGTQREYRLRVAPHPDMVGPVKGLCFEFIFDYMMLFSLRRGGVPGGMVADGGSA